MNAPETRAAPRAEGRATVTRLAWMLVAYTCLVVGLIGIVVPGLPTTPFILLAAFAADRGSPRLHGWLLRHRVFGPAIRDWQSSGAVSRRAKRLAVAVMGVSAVIMAWLAPRYVTIPSVAVMAAVSVWLWRRPEPMRDTA